MKPGCVNPCTRIACDSNTGRSFRLRVLLCLLLHLVLHHRHPPNVRERTPKFAKRRAKDRASAITRRRRYLLTSRRSARPTTKVKGDKVGRERPEEDGTKRDERRRWKVTRERTGKEREEGGKKRWRKENLEISSGTLHPSFA